MSEQRVRQANEEHVKDVNGHVGRVTDRWRQGTEWFVRVEYENGGSRIAPEGCFKPADATKESKKHG